MNITNKNITQELLPTLSVPARLNGAASKTKIPISLMAALLALLSSASSGMAALEPVNLRSAGNFVILSKTGITDVYASAIVGNVGTSPITGAALLLACDEVTGTIMTVDAAGPACSITAPSLLTTAIGDMQTAYTDAAGRLNPDTTELGAGNINDMTILPGLYKWSGTVAIPIVVTLSGGPNDVWIFQISGDLTEGNGAQVILQGGAQAKNIFWQVAGQTTLGTTASFQGVVLCKTLIAMNTGAVLNGRALSQTAVTLQMNAVIEPAN
jgi:Ice-binding-like